MFPHVYTFALHERVPVSSNKYLSHLVTIAKICQIRLQYQTTHVIKHKETSCNHKIDHRLLKIVYNDYCAVLLLPPDGTKKCLHMRTGAG